MLIMPLVSLPLTVPSPPAVVSSCWNGRRPSGPLSLAGSYCRRFGPGLSCHTCLKIGFKL
eukprot:2259912-Pyramimonas_sp.AAC.1